MRKISVLIILLLSLCYVRYANAQKIPVLNEQIIKYVESVMGTKVDRGECWDLANQALELIEADWDKRFIYGTRINPKTDRIFPGDLIQFENLKVRYKKGNATYTELMLQHTAIVYKVLGKRVFEIAHQNTEFSGRKVGISKFNINHVVEGNYYFYRPTKELSHE